MDGRAGGLGHGPLVPNLLSVVATPETNSDVVTLGHRNGLLLERREIRMRKSRTKKKDEKEERLFKGQRNRAFHFTVPYFKREEDREPGEHPRRVRVWFYTCQTP